MNSKSDVWSLGIILFELLYQKNPWEGMEKLVNIDKRNLLKIIEEGLIKTKNKTLFFPNNPKTPDEFQEIFLSMTEEDDKKRISFLELSNLPIFKNKIKILKIPLIKQNMDCIKMNISNELDSSEKSPEELKHEDFYEKTSSSKKNSNLYAINETNSPLEECKNFKIKKSLEENNIKDYDDNYKMFKSLNINEQTEQIVSFSKESNKICLEEKNNNNIVFISQLILKSNLTYIPINKIIFGEIIKRGGFGIVFKAIINLIDYAVKKIVNVKDEFLLKVIKEASNLRNYENPRLIKIYGLSYNFHKNDELLDVYLIFELKQFDLKEAINSLKLVFSQKLRIALQIAQGVYFLHNHEKPLVHADLKPANILLDESLNIYIGDLGISKILDDAIEITSSKSCTLGYSSPEQTLCNRIGKYSDIWSLGLVYYFLFFEKNFEWDKNGLYQGKSLTILDKSQDFNEIKVQQLIEKMVVNDPNERIKIEDVIGYLNEIKI